MITQPLEVWLVWYGLEGLCTVQQRPSSRGAPTLAVHPVQQGVNKWLTPLAEGGNKVVLPPG
eukprot:scaffold309_cov136-Isochrysis_galbana.AAC.3